MNRKLNITILIICSLFLIACQTEEHEVLTEEAETALQADAEFYNLVQRLAMYDGSLDDEIDDSPCFSIRFPYNVTLNGTSIKIQSNSELEAFLDGMQGMVGRKDFAFEFPITLKMANYKNIIVNSRQEFLEYMETCEDEMESGQGAITCIELDYPVKLLVYKTATQRTFSANIANKEQLFIFMNNRQDDEIVGFEYPFELIDSDNSEIEIYDRAEFEEALSECQD